MLWRKGRNFINQIRYAHKVHCRYPPALRKSATPYPLPVENSAVVLIVAIVIIIISGSRRGMLAATHEGEQACDEFVRVERAGAGLHRTRLVRADMRDLQEQIGVIGRLAYLVY